ncbi:MAG: DedA family protein [Candidatus Woesearchaeota archaeon]
MGSQEQMFKRDATFEYEHRRKKIFGYSLSGVLVVLAVLVLVYLLSLQHVDFFLIHWINAFASHITETMKAMNLLAVIYTAVFGGLFFVLVPLEVLLIKFFTEGNNPVLVVLFYVLGLTLSFTLNYHVGKKLTTLSKRLITTKKFYQIKSKLNRYGATTIFVFNALPLPSPPLSAILGVFKYNKKRFYLYFISAQLLKATVLAIVVVTIM